MSLLLLFISFLSLIETVKVFRITKCKQVFHEFVVEQQAKFQSWQGCWLSITLKNNLYNT